MVVLASVVALVSAVFGFEQEPGHNLEYKPEREPQQGFPVYFSSFEELGEHVIQTGLTEVEVADRRITDWTRGCPADAFVLINDHNRFDPINFKRLQRHAEHSLTRGSMLTDEPVNLHELALDLESYCSAELVVLHTDEVPNITAYVDTRPRVFYIDLVPQLDASHRNAVLDEVLRIIPSPFSTVIYVSQKKQSKPILRSVRTSPQRSSWTKRHLRHNKEKIVPVIAPIFNHRRSEDLPIFELPDNFFTSLLIGSLGFVLVMAWRDYGRHRYNKIVNQIKKDEQRKLAELAELAEVK